MAVARPGVHPHTRAERNPSGDGMSLSDTDNADPMQTPRPRRSLLRRYGPIAIIATGALLAFVFGRDYLNFATLERNYEALLAWRDANIVLAGGVYMLAYVASVAFSLPGAIWLTLLGGFLFGLVAGSIMVVTAATAGATLIFLAARTSLGVLLHEKAPGFRSAPAGPWPCPPWCSASPSACSRRCAR